MLQPHLVLLARHKMAGNRTASLRPPAKSNMDDDKYRKKRRKTFPLTTTLCAAIFAVVVITFIFIMASAPALPSSDPMEKGRPWSKLTQAAGAAKKASRDVLSRLGAGKERTFHSAHNFNSFKFPVVSSPLDSPTVSVSAWIKLSPRSKLGGQQTIVSNRELGCSVDTQHDGYSLAVDRWDKNDRSLVLTVGGATSGCATLTSPPGAVPVGLWVHVAYSIAPQAGNTDTAKLSLYLDGRQLSSALAPRRPQASP
jgi:hypothetical protein